jgi:hypothetical protein
MAASLLNLAQIFADGIQIETEPARVFHAGLADFFDDGIDHFSSSNEISRERAVEQRNQP